MIDINKSIEELENDYWGDPALDSYVITTCHKARQKPIRSLSNEEIRCLIGQKTGIKYLLSIAVGIVKKEPFIDITLFEGDLLLQLLRLEINDWKYNPNELQIFITIIFDNRSQIEISEDIPRKKKKKYI